LEERAALVPEDGDERCVHNANKRLVYCTATHPRRWLSTAICSLL